MDILQMSVSAGILILVTAVVRIFAINKLPKKLFIVLWGIALCRLTIPFSIRLKTGFADLTSLLDGFFIRTRPAGKAVIAQAIPYQRPGNLEITLNPPFTRAILLVWAVGAVLMILFFAVSYYRCFREIRTALPVKNNPVIEAWLSEQNTNRKVRIFMSDRITTPLTYGILKPRILLPKAIDMGNEAQLRYILAHELIHIKRLDAAWKLLLIAALCFHWFNPLVWILYRLMNRDLEITCDEKVIRLFGENMKSAYALSLIGMAERKARLTPLYSNFSKNATEERIVSIMKFRKTSLASLALALVMVAGAMSVFAESAAISGFMTHGAIIGENGLTYSFDIDKNGGVTVRDAEGKVISTSKVGSDGGVVLTDENGKMIKKFILGMPMDNPPGKFFISTAKPLGMINGGLAVRSTKPVGTGGADDMAVFESKVVPEKGGAVGMAVFDSAVPPEKGGAVAENVVRAIKGGMVIRETISAGKGTKPEIFIEYGDKGVNNTIPAENKITAKASAVKKELAGKTTITAGQKAAPNNNIKIWYNYNYK